VAGELVSPAAVLGKRACAKNNTGDECPHSRHYATEAPGV
jgi:hypothetical protein